MVAIVLLVVIMKSSCYHHYPHSKHFTILLGSSFAFPLFLLQSSCPASHRRTLDSDPTMVAGAWHGFWQLRWFQAAQFLHQHPTSQLGSGNIQRIQGIRLSPGQRWSIDVVGITINGGPGTCWCTATAPLD